MLACCTKHPNQVRSFRHRSCAAAHQHKPPKMQDFKVRDDPRLLLPTSRRSPSRKLARICMSKESHDRARDLPPRRHAGRDFGNHRAKDVAWRPESFAVSHNARKAGELVDACCCPATPKRLDHPSSLRPRKQIAFACGRRAGSGPLLCANDIAQYRA